LRGIRFRRQVALPLNYKGILLDCSYRLDVIVEQQIVVELKSVDALDGIHLAQLLTYLKLSNHTVGLLINFNVPLLKQGIRRVSL
jgi:GxxExxY protein